MDSVASYSSQNHVDRIRTQNFSAASCQDDCDFGSIKTSLFRRSSTNLEYPIKRPESVTSTSSTRSRLRDLVERKTSQEDKPAANTVADIQYFENPTETLEFDKPRNTLDIKRNSEERPKKKKSKYKDSENKNKKQEKYQSKLAEYYKVPVQLPQDEFYQHLTRSKAAEEFLQNRFSNSDTEFSGSYGRLCKHKETEGSNLRRSRSLAVIREETFTDLQIQNHPKTKRSQLIPRARLFDKPCFRDRLTGRTKYQTKEEVLEGIYIDSTVSCFADINRQAVEEELPLNLPDNIENNIAHDDIVSRNESRNSKSIGGSWPNLNEDTKHINLSEDSIGHSHNPSEIDSLDSNYVRKHYNFEAHLKNYNNSSPETERSIASQRNCKELYITTDDHDSENEIEDRPKSLAHSCTSILDEQTKQSNNETATYDEISNKSNENEKPIINVNSISYNADKLSKDCDIQSVISENDGTISSPTDSITSYISISIASSDKSHKLEYLANSLAEKIDEYCDSQFQENNSVKSKNILSDKKDIEPEPVYTPIYKKTTFADIKKDSYNNKHKFTKEISPNTLIQSKEYYASNTLLGCNDNSKDSYCTSSKNITTEPFVATFVENQYYSLPDINISKCLRKSERIDAQLRKEDPEDIPCENTYEVAQTHFREILSAKSNENYGHLNKIDIKLDSNCNDISNSYQPEIPEPQLIQNFSKLEDDLKSIITIESSNADECQSNTYHLDHHQNEREINEIEGTIRNNKIITKSESLKLASKIILKPEVKILKSFSNDNINKSVKEKKTKCGIKKHYSLRQRNPSDDEIFRLPSPTSVENKINKPLQRPTRNLSFSEQIKNHSLLSKVQSFKTSAESSIAIIPLSGHQTLVIDPPLDQQLLDCNKKIVPKCEETNNGHNTKIKLNPEPQKIAHFSNKEEEIDINTEIKNITKEPFITIKLKKVVKKTIPKLNTVHCDAGTFCQQLLRPPQRLIINDSKDYSKNTVEFEKADIMTRPQVLQVIDSKTKRENTLNNYTLSASNLVSSNQKLEQNLHKKDIKPETNTVKEKLNNAIKTDIEYQEKINSVKTYWSKLIDKSPENFNNREDIDKNEIIDYSKIVCEEQDIKEEIKNIDNVSEVSVNSIIKTLENVKIVDSIKKITQKKLNLWKDETEKVKSDSEIEEPPVEKVIKENIGTIYDNPRPEKQIKKVELELCRDTPEIEIVELSSDDNKNQKTQATLIKAKGFDKGCDDFDHVRYKVMKSELFKNSMIANYRKEAQFDGLLQYLQDYSFQELLVNNNIVIIEPVRTKVEPAPRKNTNTDTCKIPPALLKKNEYSSHVDKSKNAIRRHFFYHPIRVNKEIIEEELPNPDTVKKVRNLFEDTLKMKSPMTHDPPLLDENTGLTQRATSYRNLSEETKSSKVSSRKKNTRQLTIDTNIGNKKWDNASLSSGVSSGDLSSNNEYETDGLSPYSQKTLKDNVYSSSDEYLCDSASQDFCCESQYVSPDILKKIRECGTSVTYYGGKVVNSKTSSAVSPMTKAIMEEIKSLQKNCSRDCYSCQTKCKGERCSCLVANKHQQRLTETQTETFAEFGNNQSQDKSKRMEGFPGFKFKLVKSNSCSSRLELTGTDEAKNLRHKFRKQNSKEDPPLLYDDENSVKNKICRLESYNKGIVKTPFQQKECEIVNFKTSMTIENHQLEGKNDLIVTHDTDNSIKLDEKSTNKLNNLIAQDKELDQTNKQANENITFETKFYYVNDNSEQSKITTGKFGEMVFEEFEVLETCFDSLNSNRSLK